MNNNSALRENGTAGTKAGTRKTAIRRDRTDGTSSIDVPSRVPTAQDKNFFDDEKAALATLDRTAFEMEQTWGVDTLRLYVGEELRQKFDQQLERLNEAIGSGDQERVGKAASAMTRAWRALDAAARREGHRPRAEVVFIGDHPRHGKICIYQTGASIGQLPNDVPRFHIDEIIKFIPELLFSCEAALPRQPGRTRHGAR